MGISRNETVNLGFDVDILKMCGACGDGWSARVNDILGASSELS